MKITFQTWFETLNEEQYEVEVTGTFSPGRPGTRHGYERFVEPDDPAEFEIESVVEVLTGREFTEEDNPKRWDELIDKGIEEGYESSSEEYEYEF